MQNHAGKRQPSVPLSQAGPSDKNDFLFAKFWSDVSVCFLKRGAKLTQLVISTDGFFSFGRLCKEVMQNQFTDADKMLEMHRLTRFDFSLSFDSITVIVSKCYPKSECARLSTRFSNNNTLNLLLLLFWATRYTRFIIDEYPLY